MLGMRPCRGSSPSDGSLARIQPASRSALGRPRPERPRQTLRLLRLGSDGPRRDLEQKGVGLAWMAENAIGPVLFREEARSAGASLRRPAGRRPVARGRLPPTAASGACATASSAPSWPTIEVDGPGSTCGPAESSRRPRRWSAPSPTSAAPRTSPLCRAGRPRRRSRGRRCAATSPPRRSQRSRSRPPCSDTQEVQPGGRAAAALRGSPAARLSVPLLNERKQDTLWETVHHASSEQQDLYRALTYIYSLDQGGRRPRHPEPPHRRPHRLLHLRQHEAVPRPDHQPPQRQLRLTSTSSGPTPRASMAWSSRSCSRPTR